MNDPRYQKLLQDMVDDATEGFRQDLFNASVREVCRRKAKAKPILSWAIAAGIVLAAGILFSSVAHRTGERAGSERVEVSSPVAHPEYTPIEIVSAAPPITLVENRKDPTLVVDNSRRYPPPELLGDTELLALFPDKPAGLLADFGGAVRLVFFRPSDQDAIGHF